MLALNLKPRYELYSALVGYLGHGTDQRSRGFVDRCIGVYDPGLHGGCRPQFQDVCVRLRTTAS